MIGVFQQVWWSAYNWPPHGVTFAVPTDHVHHSVANLLEFPSPLRNNA